MPRFYYFLWNIIQLKWIFLGIIYAKLDSNKTLQPKVQIYSSLKTSTPLYMNNIYIYIYMHNFIFSWKSVILFLVSFLAVEFGNKLYLVISVYSSLSLYLCSFTLSLIKENTNSKFFSHFVYLLFFFFNFLFSFLFFLWLFFFQ